MANKKTFVIKILSKKSGIEFEDSFDSFFQFGCALSVALSGGAYELLDVTTYEQ